MSAWYQKKKGGRGGQGVYAIGGQKWKRLLWVEKVRKCFLRLDSEGGKRFVGKRGVADRDKGDGWLPGRRPVEVMFRRLD